MKVIETILPGVLILEPKVHGDSRGFFRKRGAKTVTTPSAFHHLCKTTIRVLREVCCAVCMHSACSHKGS